jgi:hypothetical protein
LQWIAGIAPNSNAIVLFNSKTGNYTVSKVTKKKLTKNALESMAFKRNENFNVLF